MSTNWVVKISITFNQLSSKSVCLSAHLALPLSIYSSIVSLFVHLYVFFVCSSTCPSIGLHHLLDGVPNPEYKLFCFIQLNKYFCKEQKALAFNRDRCCHLALCIQLILFHSSISLHICLTVFLFVLKRLAGTYSFFIFSKKMKQLYWVNHHVNCSLVQQYSNTLA